MSRISKTWRVEVEWHDSALHTEGWERISAHIAGRKKRVRCYSVGYVLADDKQGIVLASSVNGSRAAGVVTIPKRQIVKRRRLR